MKKIWRDDLPFFVTEHEGQTKIKHGVLKTYLDKWIDILGSSYNLVFIDCCAGWGVYIDSEGDNLAYGSTILAAKSVEKKPNRNLEVFAIEESISNLDNLKKAINFLELTASITFINDKFENVIEAVLKHCKNKAIFVFIDPFGYNIDYNIIKRICNFGKSEVLINFMYNAVSRFIFHPEQPETMHRLFGCSIDENIMNLSGSERENAIVKLYCNQLKEIATYVLPFRLCFDNQNRTYYYLIHLTDHIKGCKIFKSAFAENNFGRIEYLGKYHQQVSIFDSDDYKISMVKGLMREIYSGREITYLEILNELIVETIYLETHIRRAIKSLEANKNVKVIRKPPITDTGRRRISIQNQDIIKFNGR